ncbi:D,L-glycerol 3-phosphate phosphatase [Tepidimonas alkaliphilus]|uniref:D,L-glycerol 3-phosphate phosphatase n=1 Tax=Tepidimonas alkaliphilus TaxID=2588942 RepID=A0A554W7U8_9BURK|nr:HAD hydrolase-like protein [Tepidimonas alkaliphilus]TSE19653.1 D,L-glycerol 3-phosphate phosphatase [Tepidimonas alkaliphilus]
MTLSLSPNPDAWALVQAYEAQRHLWPEAPKASHAPQLLHSLDELLPLADALLLDAFGVLNLGAQAIPGAAAALARARAAGVAVRVVSNAASVPKAALLERYRAMGFDGAAEEWITSRDVTVAALQAAPPTWRWAVVTPPQAPLDDLPLRQVRRCGDGQLFDGDDAVLFLASQGWDEAAQARLEAGLRQQPRPVWVANPDLISPWERGWVREPGGWCAGLEARTGAPVQRLGKPYPAIFERALATLPQPVRRDRVWMLGDTLHTDVLGALASGLRAAWVTGAGASAGLDWARASALTGIVPHAVLPFLGPA